MTQTARTPGRTIRFLVGALATTGLGAALVAMSEMSASAAACQGCVVVSAPTISLNATAQPGLQDVIDQEGGVAVYTPLTTGAVGGPGTVWLVGHRTTHGAVFNQVPSLAAGDPINLIDDAGAHLYIVNRLLVVSESDWNSHVNIDDTSRSLLILQTSHPDSKLRYLIEAFGVGLVPTASVSAPTPPAPTPPETSPSTTSAPAAAAAAPEQRRLSKFGAIKSAV